MTTTTTNARSAVKASASPVKEKKFNYGFPSLHYPEEFLGTWQPKFSTNFVYVVPQDKIWQVHDEILENLIDKVQFGALGNSSFRRIDYLDNAYKSVEEPRNYILIEKETVRGTRLTVSLKVITMGENLFVSIEAYVLGGLNQSSVQMHSMLTIGYLLAVLVFLFDIFGSGFSIQKFFILCFLVPLGAIFISSWKNTVRAWFNHGDLGLALRQSHSGYINQHSFNQDDMMMFFKSTLPLIIYSIQDVFAKHGLPIKNLEQFSQNIMNVTSISNESGSISFKNVIFGNNNKNSHPGS